MSNLQLNDPTKKWAVTGNYFNSIYNAGMILDASGAIQNAFDISFNTNGVARLIVSDSSNNVTNNLVVQGSSSLQSLTSLNEVDTGIFNVSRIIPSLANPVRTDVSYNFSVVSLANTFTDLSSNYNPTAYNGQFVYVLSTNTLYVYNSPNWIIPGAKTLQISVSGNTASGTYVDPSNNYTYAYAVWTTASGAGGNTSVYPATNAPSQTFPSAITINSLSYISPYNQIDFLIVGGGGGGGGGYQGGGGGAGGLISSLSSLGATGGGAANPGPYTPTTTGSYSVSVGAGGIGARFVASPGTTGNLPPAPGGNSSIGFYATLAAGGGSGSGEQNATTAGGPTGAPAPSWYDTTGGGSGAGGSHGGPGLRPASNGIAGQGYNGGTGYSGITPGAVYGSCFAGGGGGGAGAVGGNTIPQNAPSGPAPAGNGGTGGGGGSGVTNRIVGATYYGYACGGGGSTRNGNGSAGGTAGPGGQANGVTYGGAGSFGGGGAAQPGGNAVISGNNGYGSGGGAGSSSGGTALPPSAVVPSGGDGVAGIVVIRWVIGP
jgi:hypothetical protein